ncbi:MAG: hypothetical protein RJQ01_02325, partial [Microcella sp.]
SATHPAASAAAPRAAASAPRPAPEQSAPEATAPADSAAASAPSAPVGEEPAAQPAAEPLSLERIVAAWPAILARVETIRRNSWTVVYTATPVALDDDVLTLSFTAEREAASFKERTSPADSVSEHLRTAIQGELGHRVKYRVRIDPPARSSSAPEPATSPASDPPADPPADPEPAPPSAPPPTPRTTTSHGASPQTTSSVTDWSVAAIPGSPPRDAAPADSSGAPDQESQDTPAAAPAPAAARPAPVSEVGGKQRYGESVVREVLGARFLSEEVLEPAVSLVGASETGTDVTAGVGAPPASPVPSRHDPDQPSDDDAPPEYYPDEPRDE